MIHSLTENHCSYKLQLRVVFDYHKENGIITGMHVDEIMKNYNPVYPTGGTWQDTFQVMRESPSDFNIVNELVSELEKYGEFRETIVLSTEEEYVKEWADYEFDEGEELDPYSPFVKDGTHRVFAHYLSEHKDAKVQFGQHPDGEEPDNNDWYPMIVSRVSFPATLDEECADELFNKCRSFKLTEDIWINSDMMSSYYSDYDFYWSSGLEMVEDLTLYVALINAKVTEMVNELGQTPIIDTAVVHSEEEDDAFFGRETPY